MRSIGRRGFSGGMLSLLAAACGGRLAADGDDAPAGTKPDAGAWNDASPGPAPSVAALPVEPFTWGSPPPEVVWSWTTAAQAAEVRAGRVLFTVESSPTMGRGFLFDLLEERAKAGDASAKRLVGPELAKGRFGWINPWATVLGATAGESYGLELLCIRMKPDTLYARIRSSTSEITFVDARGQYVDPRTALIKFERVGGILFDNDVASGRGCGTFGQVGSGAGGGDLVYREIYLGNEAQIASFSHRTSEILDVIDGSRAALEEVRAADVPPRSRGQWACDIAAAWWGRFPSSAVDRYLSALAFATERYDPTMANLDALVAELVRARFVPDPFVHTP